MQPNLELDISLARQVNEGSREALEQVVRRHLDAVYRYTLRRLGRGREEMAARITSDAFDDALRRMSRYPKGEKTVPMRHWLIRLANRRIERSRAKKKGHSDVLDLFGDELTELEDSVAELKGRDATATTLALFEEMGPEEIASVLGASKHAAMRHLRHGLHTIGKARIEQAGDWSIDG